MAPCGFSLAACCHPRRCDPGVYNWKVTKLRLKIGEEMAKDQPDRGKLTGYFKEVNDNRGQMEIKRLDFILDITAGLTPEQKAKFKGSYGKKTGEK